MTPRGEDQRSLALIYSTQPDNINKCLNVTQVPLSAPPNILSDNVWAKHRSELANDINGVLISHGSHLLEFDWFLCRIRDLSDGVRRSSDC